MSRGVGRYHCGWRKVMRMMCSGVVCSGCCCGGGRWMKVGKDRSREESRMGEGKKKKK